MKFCLRLSLVNLSYILLVGCANTDSSDTYPTLSCSNTSADSQLVNGSIQRIVSHTNTPNVYHNITTRSAITMDYMVHGQDNTKALLILITGGQLEANLNGTEGGQATSSSGNFLVRSAHLFANRGYKVVTIDQPSDAATIVAGSASGSALDVYRTSADHHTDLNAVIAAENALGLPVVIAGTSRGTISAVAQQDLADYLLLSAPVTSGGGTPVGNSAALPASVGNKPVHIIWHADDACFVSTPQGAIDLVTDFGNATGVQVSGGYNKPDNTVNNPDCKGGRTYHGFVGIETCVVENTTTWLDGQLGL